MLRNCQRLGNIEAMANAAASQISTDPGRVRRRRLQSALAKASSKARSAIGQPDSRVRATARAAAGKYPGRLAVRTRNPPAQVSQARLTRMEIQFVAPQ